MHDLGRIFLKDYNDKFDRSKVTLNDLTEEKGKCVKLANCLEIDISSVSSKVKDVNSDDVKKFRKAWTHRFPKNIEKGYSETISRIQTDGDDIFGFTGIKPLKILESDEKTNTRLIDLLENEYSKILLVFKDYHKIINEIYKKIERNA